MFINITLVIMSLSILFSISSHAQNYDVLTPDKLGMAVVEGELTYLNCVRGKVVTSYYEEPKISYKLKVEREVDSITSFKLIAEMEILRGESELTDVINNLEFKLDNDSFEEVCGKGYLSKIFHGDSISKVYSISFEDFSKVPQVEIKEGSEPMDFVFSNLLTSVLSKLPSVIDQGFLKDSKWEPNAGDLALVYQNFKKWVLSQKVSKNGKDGRMAPYSQEVKTNIIIDEK